MKKLFVFIVVALCFCAGNKATSQVATVTGDFSQGLRCVAPGVQSAMFELRNISSNSAGITSIKWEIKEAATGNIIYAQTYSSNFTPYLALISQAGTYWAVMTVWWGNIERKDSMQIVVNPMPQFSFAKNTDSICPGEGITFNYTMTSPFTQGMVSSVAWDFGDGGTSTQSAPVHNYQNVMNREISYPVSLTITDTNQCSNRLEYSDFVFIRTKPNTDFAADNAYFCFGGATAPEGKPVFTNYTDTGMAGVNNTYRWVFGDGTTSTSEHETHTYAPGTYPVTLVATNQYGCVDSVVKSNYIRVVRLTPKFSLIDTVFCSLPDTIYPEGESGTTVSYSWFIDGIMNGGQEGRTPTFIFRKQDVGTHTLKLTITDSAACSVDTTVTLHLFDRVPSAITAADTNECDPNHVITFNNTTSYPWADDFGKAQTNWDFYDGTTGTGHTTTHTYGTSAVPDNAYPDGGYGNYRVKMTGTTPYGCPMEPAYQYIHIFRIHAMATVIDPAPPNPPHGCAPHEVTLANIPDSLISSSDIVSYVWRWNFDETGTNPNANLNDTTEGAISGQETHTYTDTGRYNVYLTLTNEQGCVHDIYVQHIRVGDTVLVDFKFEPDTNCKDLISIKVLAYDSLNFDGSLAGNAWANEWQWLDDEDNPIAGPTDTTEVHPQKPGTAYIKLQSSHNGCKSYFTPVVSGVDVGIVCPPVATIKEPRDDSPGQHPVYCELETIPFMSDSKGAIYQRWYAGDYYPYVPKDTVHQSKSPLIKWNATLGDYIQYNANGDSVGTGADWGFMYNDTSATDYLMKLGGVITLSLWAMNDSSVTDDPNDEMFNLCGYCENWAEQMIFISHARMNFTVSDDAFCQGDSVRFYDATQSSVGLFGWGFKFDSAWNADPNYIEDYITIGKIIEQHNYMPDPKYSNGYWLPFSKPNKYRVVLQDTCNFGCIRNDTLVLSVLPKSVPNFTSSLDGVNYRYKREPNSDTLCINSGGQYYLRDSSWSPHPYENAQITGWDWRVGGTRDTTQHPVLTVTTAGYHDLYLTVKNEYGCDSTHDFQYQLLASRVMPQFSTPRKNVCNKTEVAFTNQTTVLPAANNRNTLLELKYDWGDGDSSIIYAKSQEQLVTGHTYDLPNLNNPVTIRLKATIVDPVTHASLGCEEEYTDSIVVSRPIALFTDDGHEFPCPDNISGVKGRTINFTDESLGVLGANSILAWNFGDTVSGIRNTIVGVYTDQGIKNPIHKYDHAGIYDVLLIVQDENRCRDSLLRQGHVRILGARGSFTYMEESSNCKPSQVTFIPSVEQDLSFLPDSLAIHTGTGDVVVNRGDYYNLIRTRRIIYNEAGAYLPVYLLYKTVDFHGTPETCIIQIAEEDTIYVIDLQVNFETEPLYRPNSINPITFKNTSTWFPNYLQDSMVSITWDMGNGDSSQTYYDAAYKDETLNGKTRYNTPGIYPVKLTMQVSNCIREKTVLFEVIMHNVTVNANDSTMGIVTGYGDYVKNMHAAIEAIPNTGYRFLQWNDGNTQNPRTITVTQDTAFTANFVVAKTLFSVFVTANNTNMGSVFGSGDYAKDSTITIGAIANSGYRFVQWNDGIKQNPRSITVTQDSIFMAEFAVATPGMFHVSLTVNNAGMGSVAGSGDYAANSIASIGAIANQGYRFVQWNDGNTDNPRSITVTQDTSFIATLEPVLYNVSLTRNDISRGVITGSGNYVAYSAVTITATPNAGYRFVGWSDNNKESTRIITVTHDITLVAIFGIENMYYVYAAPQDTTMGNVTGSNDYHKRNNGENSPVFKREYAANSVASITAISNSGYRFVQWNDGSTDNPREFTVTGDSIFTAIFESNVGITDATVSTISVYPNPATDNIHIVLPDNVAQAIFTLYDMQGKMLIRQEVNSQKTVSVSKFASGIYIYHVRTEKENCQGKIIKR